MARDEEAVFPESGWRRKIDQFLGECPRPAVEYWVPGQFVVYDPHHLNHDELQGKAREDDRYILLARYKTDQTL